MHLRRKLSPFRASLVGLKRNLSHAHSIQVADVTVCMHDQVICVYVEMALPLPVPLPLTWPPKLLNMYLPFLPWN